MSQWTAPVTLANDRGEITIVGYVDGPAFSRAAGIAIVDSVTLIDKHGESDALEAEARSHVGQSLSAWREWARAHPRRIHPGWHESESGRRLTRKGPDA